MIVRVLQLVFIFLSLFCLSLEFSVFGASSKVTVHFFLFLFFRVFHVSFRAKCTTTAAPPTPTTCSNHLNDDETKKNLWQNKLKMKFYRFRSLTRATDARKTTWIEMHVEENMECEKLEAKQKKSQKKSTYNRIVGCKNSKNTHTQTNESNGWNTRSIWLRQSEWEK